MPLWPRGQSARQSRRSTIELCDQRRRRSAAGELRGRQFDAIFVYEPSPVTVGIPAAVLRALKRAPVAFWVLDLWPETLQALGVLRSRWGLKVVGRLVVVHL